MKQWLLWVFPNRQRNWYALTVLAIIAAGVIAASGAKLVTLM
jgi:hypothetical protein